MSSVDETGALDSGDRSIRAVKAARDGAARIYWQGGTRAVTASEGQQSLELAIGAPLRFELVERFCVGWSDTAGRARPCPDRAMPEGGARCEACSAKHHEPFGFGGAGRRDVRQQHPRSEPHIVYLAAYGYDGGEQLVKVGTAQASRRTRRLREQGARAALVLAECADEAAALRIERAMSTYASDRVHPAVRLRALAAAATEPPDTGALPTILSRRADELRHRLSRGIAGMLVAQPEELTIEQPAVTLPSRLTPIRPETQIAGGLVGCVGGYIAWRTRAGALRAATTRSLSGWRVRELADGELEAEQLELFAVAA